MQECLDLIIGAGATWGGGGRGPPPSPLQETRASPTKDAFLESTHNAKFPPPACPFAPVGQRDATLFAALARAAEGRLGICTKTFAP